MDLLQIWNIIEKGQITEWVFQVAFVKGIKAIQNNFLLLWMILAGWKKVAILTKTKKDDKIVQFLINQLSRFRPGVATKKPKQR